ncbi:MAG: hypothetical protein MI745_05240 [Pseudomonadales bacterium]|nr:hypothetical protein [Pseudomonadales bacterium]
MAINTAMAPKRLIAHLQETEIALYAAGRVSTFLAGGLRQREKGVGLDEKRAGFTLTPKG